MKVTFLGTGGSEGYPAAFCRCARCMRARALGGTSLRLRSSLLVNDDLIVDLGPDVPAALSRLGLDLGSLQQVLITHAHDDHFAPVALKYRLPKYGARPLPELRLWGSGPTLGRLAALTESAASLALTTREVHAGDRFTAGHYSVLAVAATHAPELEPLLYGISDGLRTILYATDTGPLSAPAWDLLRTLRLDAVILDCTFADGGDGLHLTTGEVIEVVAKLRACGALARGAPALATHIGHRSQPDHAAVSQALARGGVTPAHDGLVLDL